MDVQELQELQKNLLYSDRNIGIQSRSTLEYELNTWRQPSIDSQKIDDEFMQTLVHTIVLADYMQNAYKHPSLQNDGYQVRDQSLIQTMEGIKIHLQDFAYDIMKRDSLWEIFKGDVEQPEMQSEEDAVSIVKQAQQRLTSVAQFREQYPQPFDQPDPRKLRDLYHLYHDVATSTPELLKTADGQKQLHWLQLASQDFAPLATNPQLKAAQKKKGLVGKIYLNSLAFLEAIPEGKVLPKEVQRALQDGENHVRLVVENLHEKHINPSDPLTLPPYDSQTIQKQVLWLQKPEQRTLSMIPDPSPKDRFSPFGSNVPHVKSNQKREILGE